MAVISKLNLGDKDITKYNNEIISNINFNGVDYHFAKPNEVTNGVCDNAVNEPIIDLKISGNSTQNGTPTPDTPIEIESVGDKTINLLPYPYDETTKEERGIKWTDNGNGSITVEGTATGYVMFRLSALKLKLQAGKKYRLLAQGTHKGVLPIFAYYNANGVRQYNGDGLEWSDDYSNPDLYLQVNPNNIASGTIYVYFVEESNKNLPYEPYGYKVPIVVQGKNLADYTKARPRNSSQTVLIDEENEGVLFSGDYYFEIPITAKGGKTYILSIESDYFRAWAMVYEDGTYEYKLKGGQIVLQRDASLLRIYKTNTSTVESNLLFKKIMLEAGETISKYERFVDPTTTNIYLTQPLRKIGDYADYIDYKNKKVIRHIVEYKATGNESYSIGAVNNDTVRFYCQAFNYAGFGTMGNSGKENIVSNKFITSSNNNVESVKCTGVIKDETSGLFNIEVLKNRIGYLDTDTSQEGVSKLKSWLQLNNITLQWVKNEYSQSIEETIDIPTIETFYGTNIFDSETTIKPSEIKVDYWKQIGVEDIAEEIVRNGSNILIVSTGAEIVQNESNLIIGG